MARLDLEGLSKVFPGGVVAVRDLSLSVADGELLVLVGPSGCGKTTTLRLIAGLEREDAGGVRVDGRSMLGLSPELRNVAMVFPRGALYPHHAVRENLAWGARLRGEQGAWWERWGRWLTPQRRAAAAQREAERDERVRNVAEQLGLSDLLDRLPSQLSDGQRQRVALGRAMVCRPSIYLMDEPLTGLDAPLRGELRRELRAWCQSTKATVVYVTHDQHEALLLGDRIAVMNGGELQQVGTPREVYDAPSNRFVAGFIGSPPINLIEGEWSDDGSGGGLAFRAGSWTLPMPTLPRWRTKAAQERGRRVVLGIRPEHVRIAAGKIAAGTVEENEQTGQANTGQANVEEHLKVRGVVRFTESAGDWNLVYVGPPEDAAEHREPSTAMSIDRLPLKGLPLNRLSNDCLAVKCGGADVPRVGEVVSLSWTPHRQHWFDAASGINLTLPESG